MIAATRVVQLVVFVFELTQPKSFEIIEIRNNNIRYVIVNTERCVDKNKRDKPLLI